MQVNWKTKYQTGFDTTKEINARTRTRQESNQTRNINKLVVTSRAVSKFNFHTMLLHNLFLKKQIKQINQARMRIQFDNFIFISETTITPMY